MLLQQRNKKGISEIVGYTLLIIIAVGISVLVYNFLNLYVPKEKTECSEGVSLTIQNVICSNNLINVTLVNKGLFTLDAAYIRIGSPDQKVRMLLNPGAQIYLAENITSRGVRPGYSVSRIFPYTEKGNKVLEVEPAMFSGASNDLALCDKAIVTQTISCS